jgi:hypothetical protein
MEVFVESQPSMSRENRMDIDTIDCGFQVLNPTFWLKP